MRGRPGFLCLSCLLLISAASAPFAVAETQFVQIKEAVVRDRANSLGKPLGTLLYTTAVKVLEKAKSWARISSSNPQLNGWISLSAISVKDLGGIKAGNGGSGSASSGEVALAGKGFNEQVEKEYQGENPKISFDWVDKMGKIVVSDDELAAFLVAGPKGAAQ